MTSPTNPAADGEQDDAAPTPLAVELMKELRSQRAAHEQAQATMAREQRIERRAQRIFQVLVFLLPAIIGAFYFLFFLDSTGFRWGPIGPAVAVVRIEGPIGAGEPASAEKIVPVLERAFGNPSVKAIVLSIDSPGGAPMEAERIYRTIVSLRKRHPKPVVAAIGNLGASAAYLIAIHADKIIAGNYSLVGSIGAVMSPWELDRAIARLDVHQSVYASGRLKSFLNPFTPTTADAEAKAHQLVDQVGGQFLAEVRAMRGNRLKPSVDYGTGEVWSGSDAKQLGLVDEIASLDEYVASTWALKTYDLGPSAEGRGILSSSLAAAVHMALEHLLMKSKLQIQ